MNEREPNWELTAALEVLDRTRCDLIRRDERAPIESQTSERRYARAKALVERIRRSLASRPANAARAAPSAPQEK